MRRVMDRGMKSSVCSRTHWIHRVNFRLFYNEQWISSVLNHEWLLLLRQAHSAWLISNMAARTVSCFEKTKPKNKKQQHVIHSPLPNETIAPFKAPPHPRVWMCPLDTWPRGTDKGPADLVEAYTLQTHCRWDTEQVGRIYFQTWHGIFTFNPNNKAPPAICKPKRKGLQVLRVYAFNGDGWFLFGMAPKVLLQGNPKVPKQTLQHSIVEHLAGNGLEGIKPVTDYTDISFLDISRLSPTSSTPCHALISSFLSMLQRFFVFF